MAIEWSDRIKSLPPYLFAEIDAKKDNIRSNGVNLLILAGISIGIVAIWVAYVFYLV